MALGVNGSRDASNTSRDGANRSRRPSGKTSWPADRRSNSERSPSLRASSASGVSVQTIGKSAMSASTADFGLAVTADADTGVVDLRLTFPDGGVGLAQSRVTETTRGTSIYSFVLHAPPVALEHVEGALDAQRVLLQSELATLKSHRS